MSLSTRIRIFSLLFGLMAVGVVWYLRSTPPLNVLLITLDTTRADHLGCYGYSLAKTPVLDRLADRGVLFERAYAPVPLTLPSHASILTGLYPPEHGLHNNGQAALPQGIPTLATELQAAGYDTGAFVAAFVLDHKFGLQRGFETYNDDLSQADPSLEGHHQYRDGSFVVNASIAWLRSRTRKPFFCWVHLFDPHYPYLAHEDRFGDQFVERPYDAEIAYVDEQIDRLISSLEKSGDLDHTIIVVVGDHGESLGEHGELTHSMTVYDATLQVPLLITSLESSRPGHRVAEPVSLVDLAPTLLDRLGLRPLPNASGRSLSAALEGEPISALPCYAETDEPYHVGHWSPQRALITPQWKYIRSPQPELYDLKADPHELQNLAEEAPDQLQALEDELAAWEERMNQRLADNVALTEQERRTLSGLGYASYRESIGEDDRPLRDVKEMLPYFYKLNDADAMMDVGRYDLAEPVLREVLSADDHYFAAHGELGRCLLKLNNLPEAVQHLRRAMELDPGADRVQSMLGAALLMHGDYAGAIEALDMAIRLNPEMIENHFNLGMTLEKLDRTEEAVEQYNICLTQEPRFAPARERLNELAKKSTK
ncbi:MAG: sulfatase-like hydrolase/transferase [Planctomycetota bacterium]|nr:sulfatase-like hydrolase/transferase [Planctomycetota bacterium]MDA1215190.1 sulfatase-like hydrolase/transferase [Planctomycetota bacterium]